MTSTPSSPDPQKNQSDVINQPVQVLQMVLWRKASAVMDGSEVRAALCEERVTTASRIQDPGTRIKPGAVWQ